MLPPDQENEQKQEARRTVLEALGLVAVLASTVLPLLLFMITFSTKARGNDFGSRGMLLGFIALLFILVSPLAATTGLYLIRKFSNSQLLHWIGWMAIVPTVLTFVFGTMSIAYEMRPASTYDPQEHQHLIGQQLRDVRPKLDTRHAVSSWSQSGGVEYKTLSFRGMEIRANSGGVITEVK